MASSTVMMEARAHSISVLRRSLLHILERRAPKKEGQPWDDLQRI